MSWEMIFSWLPIKSSIEKLINLVSKKIKHNKENWIAVPWDGKFLAYDGPLEKLLLIEDRPFQEIMARTLEAHGFVVALAGTNGLSHFADKGSRIIYLTDKEDWRQKITKNEQILVARPK